jgi:hypothetical protein
VGGELEAGNERRAVSAGFVRRETHSWNGSCKSVRYVSLSR